MINGCVDFFYGKRGQGMLPQLFRSGADLEGEWSRGKRNPFGKTKRSNFNKISDTDEVTATAMCGQEISVAPTEGPLARQPQTSISQNQSNKIFFLSMLRDMKDTKLREKELAN